MTISGLDKLLFEKFELGLYLKKLKSDLCLSRDNNPHFKPSEEDNTDYLIFETHDDREKEVNNIIKKMKDVDEKIQGRETYKEQISSNQISAKEEKQKKEEENVLKLWDCICFYISNQNIKLWERVFKNFESLFLQIRAKQDNKTQLKWGMGLIYSVAKCLSLKWKQNKTSLPTKELLKRYKEFKEWNDWDNWKWGKRWNKKSLITQTDCDMANSILKSSEVKIRFSLLDISRDNKAKYIKINYT